MLLKNNATLTKKELKLFESLIFYAITVVFSQILFESELTLIIFVYSFTTFQCSKENDKIDHKLT